MIFTEHGLTFRRTGDHWQCVDWPQLRMTRDGTYHVDGHDEVFPSLAKAMQHLSTNQPGCTVSRADVRTHIAF